VRQSIALPLVTVAVLVAAALAGRLSLAAGLLLNEGTALLIIANGLAAATPRRALRLTRTAPTPGRGRTRPASSQEPTGGGSDNRLAQSTQCGLQRSVIWTSALRCPSGTEV
jgi:hypothetical protein